MHQIMVQFGDVVPFLANPDLGSPATCSHLLEIVQSTQQYHLLRVELAAVVDAKAGGGGWERGYLCDNFGVKFERTKQPEERPELLFQGEN